MITVHAMESDWKNGWQAAGDSQRPTMEGIAASDLVELEPQVVPEEPDVPDEVALSLEKLSALPLEFGVRYAVELLRALAPLHTDLRAAPAQRVYGHVAIVNSRVRADGTARWLPKSLAAPTPEPWVAPEVHMGQVPDQQCDVFAIGMLLVELICSATRTRSAEPDALTGRLLQVARKATEPEAESRWQSALEFADELVRVTGPRLPAPAAFGMLLRDRLPGAALLVSFASGSQTLMLSSGPDSLQAEVISQREGIVLRSFSPAVTGRPPEWLTPSAARRVVGWRSVAALLSILLGGGVWASVQAPTKEPATALAVEAPSASPPLVTHSASEPSEPSTQATEKPAHGAEPAPSQLGAKADVPAPRSAVNGSKHAKPAEKATSRRRGATYEPEGI